MAPFPTMILLAERHIEWRDDGASPDQVTLSITRLTTTYATIIDLGPSSVSSFIAATSTIITTSIAAPSAAAITTPASSSASGSVNNGVIIGAVLGSILGTMVLITVIYKCCFDNRSAAWIPPFSTSQDYSDSDSERRSQSDRVQRRGGGGDGFGRENRKGDRVRRPDRARTRRSRSRSMRSDSIGERSWNARHDRRRKTTSMSNNDGLIGWSLVPRTKTYDYSHSDRHSHRTGRFAGGRRGSHRARSPDD